MTEQAAARRISLPLEKTNIIGWKRAIIRKISFNDCRMVSVGRIWGRVDIDWLRKNAAIIPRV